MIEYFKHEEKDIYWRVDRSNLQQQFNIEVCQYDFETKIKSTFFRSRIEFSKSLEKDNFAQCWPEEEVFILLSGVFEVNDKDFISRERGHI